MKDPILLNNLWTEVEAGRVSVSQVGDLSLFKYTQDTHFKGEWNAVNRQARGLIMHVDGTVVARPFPKFFNLGELPETMIQNLPWTESVEIHEKMDGSCGIGYVKLVTTDSFPGGTGLEWHLATPGSMVSDQAIEGTRMLHSNKWISFLSDEALDKLDPMDSYAPPTTGMTKEVYNLSHLPVDCTPVFEIVYPENRIVVDYHGETFLTLLAIFDHDGTEWHPRRVDQIADLCGFRRPRVFELDLRGEIPFEDNAEGYVARFESGLRVKVKSPTYLRIHKLLNYMSPKGVINLIRGQEYGNTVRQLPKEIAKDFDDVRAFVQNLFQEINTTSYERFTSMEHELGVGAPRKTQALWIQANVVNSQTGLVFGILDGKDIDDNIWKIVLEKVKEQDV